MLFDWDDWDCRNSTGFGEEAKRVALVGLIGKCGKLVPVKGVWTS